MMKLCKTCDKRDTCEELCKRAERYVNQNHVVLKEVILNSVDIFSESVEYGLERYTKKSIISLYKDGMDADEIMYHLPYSKSYVYRVIRDFEKGD
ncbi:MAG: helix-turn-helix domain-containing protein [Bacteroidota bacterium]|nr:helix-turn-helix domain-containing protein [Bacteroidota bacterium]